MSAPREPLVAWSEGPAPLPDRPVTLRNRLPGHPLFEPERIKELLRRLPRERIEIRAVERTGAHDGAYRRGPMLADDPVEAFEGLARRPTWMLLHDTWKHDRDYRALREAYLEDLSACFPELRDGIYNMGCWMFLSSGGGVVHFHADGDQSFLNHVAGGKTVYVYPARILDETTIETLLHEQDQGAVVYDPRYEAECFEPVHLTPGDSVYLPLYAPHRVTNDDDICISWNVGFDTRASRRRRRVHLVNHDLRRMGFHPQPAGRSPLRDGIKARMHLPIRAKNKLLRLVGAG